ncbi:hypothetical protein BDY19DRAFT_984980 [Irpex rosettiformis]|uniref:Uncharacterized protein n=1 Tax=Irpex rosettiformis TaxID=378272 RepID=A0ACB8U561_9APHY|nr:hypothetical protein BDY19DRAFT_984980 [Irpex rosettiformis]
MTTHSGGEFKILRPDCPAKDRLLLWRPSIPSTITPSSLSDDDRVRVTLSSVKAYNVSTLATYGAGLKLFMEVCDAKELPDRDRIPASKDLISVFLAQLVGAYSASAAKNYFAGVRAWHIIHRLDWPDEKFQFHILLSAASADEPLSSHQSKKHPYTVETLEKMIAQLEDSKPLDVAVRAVATTMFYSLGRLGEFTVSSQNAFSASKHVQISHWREEKDRNGRPTKAAPKGETVQWAKQNGISDPVEAFRQHLAINKPSAGEHLFSYTTAYRNGKTAFLTRIKGAATKAGVENLAGHAFRIGGTLEYLLRNVPFEVLYLRRHAQIMAPYIQAEPESHVQFISTIMPRVR